MLMNYHIGRFVLSSLCVGALVWLVLGGVRFGALVWLVLGCVRFAGFSLQNEPHQSSNTQRTENKTTDVVIHQHSHKLLMMDIFVMTGWRMGVFGTTIP